MPTRAFLLIKASDEPECGGRLRLMEELRSLPEVKYVVPVSGLYDCVARVEGRQTLIASVHNVMSRSGISYMEVLLVDQADDECEARKPPRKPADGRKD